MSLSTIFGFKSADVASTELPNIFPLSINEADFVKVDTLNIYTKILTDVIERTHGLTDEIEPMLWDNCLASEASDGLITLLATAMSDKADLFLVYEPGLKLLRKANTSEAMEIKIDYQVKGESQKGVFITFKKYTRTDLVKLYSSLEFCAIGSLNKSMNISKALQLKMNDLRSTVALSDAADVIAQAKQIAKSLGDGNDVLLDAKDNIESSNPDMDPTEKAIDFLNQKRSFYLGMPASYITGKSPAGLGDSGEGESKAVERGLKSYYFSVIKPVIEKTFGIDTTFKSQDFRQIGSALEAIKTFELVSDDYVSHENKILIVNKLLDLDAEVPKEKAVEPI